MIGARDVVVGDPVVMRSRSATVAADPDRLEWVGRRALSGGGHLGPTIRLSGMEVMTGAADRELNGVIASAATGDGVAFGRIVAEHHGEMHRVCMFVCRDQATAEEAVQAAWSIAWRKLGSIHQPDRLRPWLISVAVNQARDLMRKRRRRSEVEVIADPSSVRGGVDPATGIASIDLRRALERLRPEDRALLAMRYVAGFNATELSTALGLSPSGTRNRLERLTRRLRQELSDG
jgi:RNA polymerase sigma factor (sigma-70 family)